MGNLELSPTGEMSRPEEGKIPKEVLEMDKNLIRDAKLIFENNHELVKEAMFGMGSRKAKEVLENLSECRERTKKAIREYKKTKNRFYLSN
jgi:glutamate synthase domain-containing protein 3